MSLLYVRDVIWCLQCWGRVVCHHTISNDIADIGKFQAVAVTFEQEYGHAVANDML